jgi:hypothetical protein
VFSERADGFAQSSVRALTDDGWVFGDYHKYDGMNDLGDFAFLWSPQQGFFDLSSLVEGGLSAAGWERLRMVTGVYADGTLFGRGVTSFGGTMDFVLRPVVPEPTFAAAMAPMMFALVRPRRSVR